MSHAANQNGSWQTTLSRYALVPLRIFLGVTFIYAGLDKLSDPVFFDASGAGSLADQLHGIDQSGSAAVPAMIDLALESPKGFGMAIAFGELAAGLGVLLGLWTRLAALGGAAISLSLWLTVSWQIEPYYLGNDLIYLMAWLPLAMAGAAVLSADAWLTQRAGERSEVDGPSGAGRRAVLEGGLATVALGATGAVAGAVALSKGDPSGDGGTTAQPSSSPSASPSPSGSPTESGGSGGAGPSIDASSVPADGGVKVQTAQGKAAYVVRAGSEGFTAFDAACTHSGCEVNAPKDGVFYCPCHGSEFDAATGQVLKGPANKPLPQLTVREAGGKLELT